MRCLMVDQDRRVAMPLAIDQISAIDLGCGTGLAQLHFDFTPNQPTACIEREAAITGITGDRRDHGFDRECSAPLDMLHVVTETRPIAERDLCHLVGETTGPTIQMTL